MHLLLSQMVMGPLWYLDNTPIPIGELGDAQGLDTNCGDMLGAIVGVSTA